MKSKQKGQSIVEMGIFVAFIVAPLMLLIPYFSKVVEARHYNDMSARYLAWERTVWLEKRPGNWSGTNNSLAIKSTAEVTKELPLRIINGHKSVLFSDANHQRTQWQQSDAAQHYQFNQASQEEPSFLLAKYDQEEEDNKVANYFAHNVSNQSIPGVSSLIGSAISVLKMSGLRLETRGMYLGHSQIKINSHKLLENINDSESQSSGNEGDGQFELAIDSKNYIVARGWNAGGPSHHKRRVRSLVPANLFNTSLLNTFRSLLSAIPIARPIRSSQLWFGHIDVKKLPQHRMDSGISANED